MTTTGPDDSASNPRAPAPLARAGWAALAADEDGAGWSLGYLMTLPFLILLVCLVIQTALTMVVRLGTTYAAFAAARSYAVWLPANPDLADGKARQAASQAMTPFASGSGSGGGFGRAYEKYSGDEAERVSARFVDARHASAPGATRVTLESGVPRWDGDVTVSVRYEMPFHISAVGRLLGLGRSMTISSEATTQVEGVKGKAVGDPRPLGISYDPGEL